MGNAFGTRSEGAGLSRRQGCDHDLAGLEREVSCQPPRLGEENSGRERGVDRLDPEESGGGAKAADRRTSGRNEEDLRARRRLPGVATNEAYNRGAERVDRKGGARWKGRWLSQRQYRHFQANRESVRFGHK